MKRLHQGLDYRLYKLYVWGGLALMVLYLVVSMVVLNVPNRLSGPDAFLILGGPLLLWFAGIVLYWWWVLLFKGNREFEEMLQMPGNDLPRIKSLRSWNTLHQAMAIYGGNAQELVKNEKRANLPLVLWYGCINLMLIWILGFITLGALEIIPADWFGIMLYGLFAWIGLMIVGTPLLLKWGSKASEQAHLAPLGLALTATSGLTLDAIGLVGGDQNPISDGLAIVEGQRHGRLVHIETLAKRSLTVLQAPMPRFRIQSRDGKLAVSQDAPTAVVKALKKLRKAKRWQGIMVHAGPEGISIQRRSKGTDMWLYDLWLAEYLLANQDDETSSSL